MPTFKYFRTLTANGIIASVAELPKRTSAVMITSIGGTTTVNNVDGGGGDYTFTILEGETVNLAPFNSLNGAMTITPASTARVVYWLD